MASMLVRSCYEGRLLLCSTVFQLPAATHVSMRLTFRHLPLSSTSILLLLDWSLRPLGLVIPVRINRLNTVVVKHDINVCTFERSQQDV